MLFFFFAVLFVDGAVATGEQISLASPPSGFHTLLPRAQCVWKGRRKPIHPHAEVPDWSYEYQAQCSSPDTHGASSKQHGRRHASERVLITVPCWVSIRSYAPAKLLEASPLLPRQWHVYQVSNTEHMMHKCRAT